MPAEPSPPNGIGRKHKSQGREEVSRRFRLTALWLLASLLSAPHSALDVIAARLCTARPPRDGGRRARRLDRSDRGATHAAAADGVVSCSLLFSRRMRPRYQKRMDETIEPFKYERELDKNLEPAPPEGPLKELDIFVRPPKGMQPAKDFLLGGVQPGRSTSSGRSTRGRRLPARPRTRRWRRRPRPRGPRPSRRRPRRVQRRCPRRPSRPSSATTRTSPSRSSRTTPTRLTSSAGSIFTANTGKKVEVFLSKVDPYDVALIYVFDPAEEKAIDPKIRYSLEAFALGDKAKIKYAGGTEAEAEAATAATSHRLLTGSDRPGRTPYAPPDPSAIEGSDGVVCRRRPSRRIDQWSSRPGFGVSDDFPRGARPGGARRRVVEQFLADDHDIRGRLDARGGRGCARP